VSGGTAGKAPARKRPRRATTPRASFEELEIRTADGVALRAVVDDPPEGTDLRGTLVLAHAMFARRTEFGRRERPGTAQALTAKGFRTIAFDFRGHGESQALSGSPWGYDDLVRFDLPAVVACARARAEDRPVVVLGHSLGGHVALAAQGLGLLGAEGIVSVAGNVWLRAHEPSRLRWAAKLAVARAMRAITHRVGRFPARAMRVGSDDATERYVDDLLRGVFEGRWQSADGADDYLAALANVRVPVCSVASDGDRLNCRPPCAEAFVRRCGGRVEVIRVQRSDDGTAPPGHMELVTTARARSALLRAVEWVEGAQ
jgi:predicted alpha/beta hydrolase